MKLKMLGKNQTEINTGNGLTVFFSYETPVACFIEGDGFYRTDKKWSATTTRHINQWLKGNGATVEEVIEKSQENFDKILSATAGAL